jgi:hypothetical protein
MLHKHPICPQRLRQLPRQFSWVDQRLVRDHLLERCPAPAWGLYLLLIAAGDAQGLSYYSDASIQRRLSLSITELTQARTQLQQQGFIAFEAPLYQVLDLAPQRLGPIFPAGSRSSDGQSRSIGEVLHQMLGGAR